MEKQRLTCRLRAALKTFLSYGCQHAASRAALSQTYERIWEDNGHSRRVALTIRPAGDLYEVRLDHYLNGQHLLNENWPATYGWNSNGHLIAVGRLTYVIMNPARRLVILEDIPDKGPHTQHYYHQA